MIQKLITWENRYEKLDQRSETDFLDECGKNGNTSLFGYSRFLEFIKMFKLIPKEPKKILDVGGSENTARWLNSKFPKSKVTILNLSKKEIGNWNDYVICDGTDFETKEKYDLIFLGEVLEHTYNPDGMIASSLMSLKKDGHLVITTPNLASIYNRIFLLFGWSPTAYYPSLRYITGNPLFNNISNKFGNTMDHKSVFTWKGLTELLKIYQLEIIKSEGCDVMSNEKNNCQIGGNYKTVGSSIRPVINNLLPKSMRVGMLFLCCKTKETNSTQLKNAILKDNFWNI
jgi:SAM-dependent methyltransferase